MSFGLSYNEALVLQGVSLLGASAGVIGCFAVLRRRALTGDALAHASLPGLCLAFLVVGERSIPAFLVGAAVTGAAGMAIIAGLCRWTRLKQDAAIGIVLSVFTGVGVVLLSVIQRMPTGSRAGLASFIFGSTAGLIREDVQFITVLAAMTLAVVILGFKEFKLVAFDLEFARVQGWPALGIDFTLMLLIVLAVVIGLPAVGVLMMAALLVIPGAAARFWTERLHIMVLLAGLFGMAAGVVGAALSIIFVKLPAGPAIVLVAATLFAVSLLAAPQRGLLARLARQRRLKEQLLAPPLAD